MRVLVTGAASGLGAALTAAFLARGDEVLATDVSPPASDDRAGVHWRGLDVRSDEDWAARSQKGLGDVVVGKIRVVSTSGEEAVSSSGVDRNQAPFDPRGRQVSISILPSMGFGTGHHASTRRCLSLLQRVPLGGVFEGRVVAKE